ncbi:MAG TPA: hypothetical protein VFI25_03910 [Planctomycetota bacterium]|nr:hypothetical protein [Planctomycetota bacterium]
MDVALVTWSGLPDLDPDDRPIAEALARRGLDVRAVAWDEPGFDWGRARLALLRSTWDYHLRREEFLAWADRVSEKTALVNPVEVVRWNTHKGYLRALAEKGLPIVPTVFVEAGTKADLGSILEERGWDGFVLKPAVSADSWGTLRASRETLAPGQAHLDRLSTSRDMMVQPYLDSVATSGERCLTCIEGELSHAVQKRSFFLGGRHAGPEGVPVPIEADEAEAARAILPAAGADRLLYARVDLMRGASGEPLLSELELVEPTLFVRDAPAAVERLADGILARLRRAPP